MISGTTNHPHPSLYRHCLHVEFHRLVILLSSTSIESCGPGRCASAIVIHPLSSHAAMLDLAKVAHVAHDVDMH